MQADQGSRTRKEESRPKSREGGSAVCAPATVTGRMGFTHICLTGPCFLILCIRESMLQPVPWWLGQPISRGTFHLYICFMKLVPVWGKNCWSPVPPSLGGPRSPWCWDLTAEPEVGHPAPLMHAHYQRHTVTSVKSQSWEEFIPPERQL